jgi:anaerobic ribonucleoside-triphosphate reductase activating protein
MRIIRIDENNQVNGDGLRCVIWFAGCNHRCPGCHNPETWSFTGGHKMDFKDMVTITDQLQREEISGITLSGGDPLYQEDDLVLFLKQIKQQFPDKDVWCYTGFKYEDVSHMECLNYIDVLIDGPYEQELNPGVGKVLWRGSTNQRIVDVKQSRLENKIILYCD